MSDIYFNELTVRGSAKGVAEFRKRNELTTKDESGKVVHCPLSFSALVPYPGKDLAIPFGGYAESLYHVLYSSDEEMFEDGGVQQARLKDRKALAAYFRKKDGDAAEIAEKYRRNFSKHGHLTVFTWYPDKWGPNHDLGDGTDWELSIMQPTPRALVYYFESNWGVPDGWLMKVAKLFPKLGFTLAWEGADNVRTGLIIYRNGKQTTFIERDNWLLEGEVPGDGSGTYLRYPEGPPPQPPKPKAHGSTQKPARKKANGTPRTAKAQIRPAKQGNVRSRAKGHHSRRRPKA